jgi:NAD(P)-dependent dehydrogenase (short-subunit alcohol dehydrogenase family)
MRLENVNAVITGASSGIGQAVASHFRREGANLLLTGRRPEPPEGHPDDLYLAGDLNDENFVSRLATRAADHLGGVGVVVLCHGLQASGPLTDMTYDDARDVLHSNLLSSFLVMKHLMPLAPETGASMVCVSSRLGMVGMPNQTLYSAAKGGLIALARGAAIEWASRNIRVNVVAPGLTLTPVIEASFQRRPDPAAYQRLREDSIPLRRLATPEEIADAVLFLACPESSYITGAVLPVDGGYTAF